MGSHFRNRFMLKKCMHDLVTLVMITYIKYIGALNRIMF
jgi:hypothetical protein